MFLTAIGICISLAILEMMIIHRVPMLKSILISYPLIEVVFSLVLSSLFGFLTKAEGATMAIAMIFSQISTAPYYWFTRVVETCKVRAGGHSDLLTPAKQKQILSTKAKGIYAVMSWFNSN